MKKIKIFDKEFVVNLLSFEDNSTKGSPYVKVSFEIGGEIYHYCYSGGAMMALSSVVKENGEKVYSPWEFIPEGSYYEEIGRQLSLEQKKINIG